MYLQVTNKNGMNLEKMCLSRKRQPTPIPDTDES